LPHQFGIKDDRSQSEQGLFSASCFLGKAKNSDFLEAAEKSLKTFSAWFTKKEIFRFFVRCAKSSRDKK
jgi:hypothetical protein